MNDILITDTTILSSPGKATLQENSFIAIRHGVISQIGSMAELDKEKKAGTRIDGSGCLTMPGLANGHCHAAMTLFRGMADDLELMTWLQEHIFPAEAAHVNPEMVYWCSKLAAAEMLLSGTTLVVDSYFHAAEAACAFIDTGLRAVAAQGVIDFPAPESLTRPATLRRQPRVSTGCTTGTLFLLRPFSPTAPILAPTRLWNGPRH
jgi:5-methylthioadenosine/S-adenosylhomocysteine deaminase